MTRAQKIKEIGNKLEAITPNPRDFPTQTYNEIHAWHRRKWEQFVKVRNILIESS